MEPRTPLGEIARRLLASGSMVRLAYLTHTLAETGGEIVGLYEEAGALPLMYADRYGWLHLVLYNSATGRFTWVKHGGWVGSQPQVEVLFHEEQTPLLVQAPPTTAKGRRLAQAFSDVGVSAWRPWSGLREAYMSRYGVRRGFEEAVVRAVELYVYGYRAGWSNHLLELVARSLKLIYMVLRRAGVPEEEAPLHAAGLPRGLLRGTRLPGPRDMLRLHYRLLALRGRREPAGAPA